MSKSAKEQKINFERQAQREAAMLAMEAKFNPNWITKDMDAIHIPTGLKVRIMAMLKPNRFGPGAAGCVFPLGSHISIEPRLLRAV